MASRREWLSHVQSALNVTVMLAVIGSGLPGPVVIGAAVLASANAVRLLVNALKTAGTITVGDIEELIRCIDCIQERLTEVMAIPKAKLGAEVFEWCSRTDKVLTDLRQKLSSTHPEEFRARDYSNYDKTLSAASRKLEKIAKQLKK